jgi:2-polyprenyl-3-methyl-5-hydroxy-6-metoxy-1,4-benzoquinol methylase
MPDGTDLDYAYKNYYTHYSKSSSSTGVWHLLYRFVLCCTGLARQRAKLQEMYLHNHRPGQLLDVGCGNGERLAKFRDKGWLVTGQEVDPIAATVARKKGLLVHTTPLHQILLPDNEFDVVIMNHVLEHVTDPSGLLSECRRVMKCGGELIIVTPNSESFGHKHFGALWRGLEPPRHLYLFCPTSLNCIGTRSGFREFEILSTPVNAQFLAEGSIIEHSGTKKHKLVMVMQTLLFQLLATVQWLPTRLNGEECVFRAVK